MTTELKLTLPDGVLTLKKKKKKLSVRNTYTL